MNMIISLYCIIHNNNSMTVECSAKCGIKVYSTHVVSTPAQDTSRCWTLPAAVLGYSFSPAASFPHFISLTSLSLARSHFSVVLKLKCTCSCFFDAPILCNMIVGMYCTSFVNISCLNIADKYVVV